MEKLFLRKMISLGCAAIKKKKVLQFVTFFSPFPYSISQCFQLKKKKYLDMTLSYNLT